MEKNEMRGLLEGVVDQYIAEFDEAMSHLAPTAKNERKAYAMQKSLAGICKGSFDWVPDPAKREQTVFQRLHYFDTYKAQYDALSPQEREAVLVFAYPVSVIQSNLLEPKIKLLGSENSAEKAFEHKITVGFLRMVLAQWQAIWNEKGIFPCEVVL